MKLILLSIFVGFFYASNVSGEYVSFVNEDQEFNCIGGNPRWYLPNRSPISDDNVKYDIETISNLKSKLTIHNVNSRDIGDYYCVADDAEKTFRLHLYYPVTIDYYTKSQSVKENDNVTLKCRTIGIPSAEIIWYFQDTKLVDGPNVEINNENITLKKVQRDQSGSYACVAIQKLGSLKNIQQKNLDLTVEHGPRPVKSELQKVETTIGETTTLECGVESIPSSRFQWYLDGYEVFENVENFDELSRLKVLINENNFKKNYTCWVTYENDKQQQVFAFEERPQNSAASLNFISTFIMLLAGSVMQI